MPRFKIITSGQNFDNSYANVIDFSTRQQQNAYFNIPEAFEEAKVVNFSLGNLLYTNCVINPSNFSLGDLNNSNYLIAQEQGTGKIYFYFINDIKYNTDGQIFLNLELDIIQTFLPDTEFSECNIRRAHLDRFGNISNGKVKFNITPDSPLLLNEGISAPQRLTKRTKLKQYLHSTEVTEWLDRHIAYWVYVYIDPAKDVTYKPADGANDLTTNLYLFNGYKNTSFMLNPSGVLVFPVYRPSNDGQKVYLSCIDHDTIREFIIGIDGFEYFKAYNQYFSYVYNIKFSLKRPFIDEYQMSVTPKGLLINGNWNNDGKFIQCTAFKGIGFNNNELGMYHSKCDACIADVFDRNKIVEFDTIQSDFQYEFNVSDLKSNRQLRFNPKLLNSNFSTLRLTDWAGNTFDYDPLKFNSKDCRALYSESMQADTTSYYSRLSPQGLYALETKDNYTGIVNNADLSMGSANDKFSEYVANNKNYVRSAYAGQLLDIGVSAGMAAITKSPISLLNAGRGVANMASTALQMSFQNDNMKQAPQALKTAGVNVSLNLYNNEMTLYLEEWQAFNADLKLVDDHMYMFGYIYNELGNIDTFRNVRKYFNYVEADLENVSIDGHPCNPVIRDKFKSIFNNGIRLWNGAHPCKMYNYELENYERKLDNV
jgi:hypothetical protein